MQPPCRNTVQRFPSRLDDKYTDRWCVQERESGREKGRLERRREKRWNDAEKMLAKDMRNVKGNDVLWKKGRWLSEQQEQQHRWDWWDERRDTSGALGGGKDADAEWRSGSIYSWLKPHVSAWGEDTAALRTHARNECRHSHPSGVLHACFHNLFSPANFLCSQKLLTCHLRCVCLPKRINKYTQLFLGHLSSYLLC